MSSKDISALVGLPYNKVDCWKLAQMFYQLEFNIELKNYEGQVPQERWEQKSLITSCKGDFVPTDKPKYGDLIVINLHGVECHIAIFLGGVGLLLHTTKTTGSVIDRIGRWRKLIAGFYTLEKQAND